MIRWSPILACILALGCSVSIAEPNGSGDIRAFVQSQALPNVRAIISELRVPGERLEFFRVDYGRPLDCPSGCFYEKGIGLRYRGKIGWVALYNHANQVDTTRLIYYDVSSHDHYLFTQELLGKLRGRKPGQTPLWPHFLLMLARDSDTPEPTLLGIAEVLRTEPGYHLGMTLLENPRVACSRHILEVLVSLPGDVYQEVRRRAQALLDRLSSGSCPSSPPD